ncbi:MAG: metal ABC transporter ATP-binding protein [Phototrophicaceae bacterium]
MQSNDQIGLIPGCPALVVDDLSAGYPGNRRAIQQVSFEVDPGERVGVIGPNGAGKSTLFKALVGIIPHHSGNISLHGEACHTSHDMIGYVPQSGAIDWSFPVTVWDVVMMGRTREIGWLRWSRRHDRERVAAVLEQVGMLAYRDRQIGQLSGGQRQRVFIARALAQSTDVLLLDEPFSGVDVSAESEIMGTLDRLTADGITLVIATHDLQMASTAFDKLLVLNQTVIGYGRPDEVFQPAILRAAYGGRVGVITPGSENGQREPVMVVVDSH